MKTLTNTSPFLLLLVPIFMMIAVTFTVNMNQPVGNDVLVKPAKPSVNFIKQATVFFK